MASLRNEDIIPLPPSRQVALRIECIEQMRFCLLATICIKYEDALYVKTPIES